MRRTTCLLAAAAALVLTATADAADDLAAAVDLLNEGWGARAEARLQAIAEREPDRAEVYYQLAWARFHAEDFAGAEAWIDRAVELAPDNADFRVLQGHVVGRRAQTGSKLKALGRGRKCRECYERALALDPGLVEAYVALINFHLEAPGIVGGDEDTARDLALALADVDSVQHLLMTALVLEQVDADPDGAEAALRRAVALADRTRPQDDAPVRGFVGFCYRHDRLPAAEAMLRRHLDTPGRGPAVRRGLADVYRRQKRWGDARRQWQALVEVDSTRLDGLMGLGYLALAHRQWSEATAHFDTVHTADPARTDALYQAARSRLLAGQELARAAADLRAYLAAEPNLWRPSAGWARVRLAETLWKTGDADAAERELKLARKLRGHDEGLQRQIEQVEDAMKSPFDDF